MAKNDESVKEMIEVYAENNEFEVTYDTTEDYQLVKTILDNISSYKERGFEFKRSRMIDKHRGGNPYLLKKWEKYDGTVKLYEHSKQFHRFTLGIGFLEPFLTACVVMEIKYDLVEAYFINGKREYSLIQYDFDEASLYKFQHELFMEFINGSGRGIISAPTGSGKTMIGAEMVHYYNTNTIIVADRVLVKKQWAETIEKLRKSNVRFKNRGSGIVGYVSGEPRILIGSAKFMMNCYTKPEKYHEDINTIIKTHDLMIYDEVHRAGAKLAIDFLESSSARYKLGLSGTANMRSEKNDLEYISRIGSIVASVEEIDLIDQDKIVPIELHFVPVRRMSTYKMKYADAYNNCIIYNESRNDKIFNEIVDFIENDYKFIIFVDYIDHARELHRITNIDYTDSNDPLRNKKFEDLRSGEISGIICTFQLAGEGFDLPSLDALVFAGAGKSTIKFIQAKGRVQRVFKDKSRGFIIDFADRSKFFEDHAYERYRIYQSQLGIEVFAKGTWLYNK